jgi:RNA polymerase sigma-70 factor, ECF subfamily
MMFFRKARPEAAAPSIEVADWTDLVQQIRAGDSAAMNRLYEAFGRGAKLLLSRALGPQDADDKVHDTFVIVIRAIQAGDVREPERLMSFVRTVIRRQIAGSIDTRIRVRREEVEFDHSVVDSRATPEQAAISIQQKAVMRQMLEELSARDVQVLTRFYLREQAPENICRDLRLTEKQFQLLKSRAKARFAELVQRKLRKQRQ